MITSEIRAKLAKIYEMVQRGGTEGEKAAAKAALDKLLNKYNLQGIDLDSLATEWYSFTYSSIVELNLFIRIIHYVLCKPELVDNAYKLAGRRTVRIPLSFMDYIKLNASYEYFRRHMNKEWKKYCAPELARCRKDKTRNKRRAELQTIFTNEYFLKSGLVDPAKIVYVDMNMTGKEYEEYQRLSQIEGGKYRTQVTTGHMIETPSPTLF